MLHARPLVQLIMLKFYFRERTDLGIHQRHKISSESLKGPAGIALPRGGDAYRFLVYEIVLSVPHML